MNERYSKEDAFRVLRVLSLNQEKNITQRDISLMLGFSLGKTNYLLKSLVKRGLVMIKNFVREGGKLEKVRYNLTHAGITERLELTYFFLKRKEQEYLALRKEIEKMTY